MYGRRHIAPGSHGPVAGQLEVVHQDTDYAGNCMAGNTAMGDPASLGTMYGGSSVHQQGKHTGWIYASYLTLTMLNCRHPAPRTF